MREWACPHLGSSMSFCQSGTFGWLPPGPGGGGEPLRVPMMYWDTLTEHGCFGEYLHRIGKEATARCHYYNEKLDSAQSTLENCPAFALTAEIGVNLSPPYYTFYYKNWIINTIKNVLFLDDNEKMTGKNEIFENDTNY